jgi:transcriptional regulator with XRE-family HTH domain
MVRATGRPKMTKNEILRRIVRDQISNYQNRNPNYSKRKFASKIPISSGSLIDFLNGKRDFSNKTINKIASSLNLPSEELKKLASAPDFTEFITGNSTQIKISVNSEAVNKIDRLMRLFSNRLKKIEEDSPGLHECCVEIRR